MTGSIDYIHDLEQRVAAAEKAFVFIAKVLRETTSLKEVSSGVVKPSWRVAAEEAEAGARLMRGEDPAWGSGPETPPSPPAGPVGDRG